jgi:YidC/Oxa1 family membrane protein insertase
LAVDIELRDAPLIPGIEWCSNLAGPDKLFFWEGLLPQFLTAETGWLGPYLNVLPLITMGLFMLQQKLFTPPPTDEQTRMQMQMMKFMMIFMGFLFFKVASGLCLYFIASALWSVAERKLVPKPTPQNAGDATPPTPRRTAPRPEGARPQRRPATRKRPKKR